MPLPNLKTTPMSCVEHGHGCGWSGKRVVNRVTRPWIRCPRCRGKIIRKRRYLGYWLRFARLQQKRRSQ